MDKVLSLGCAILLPLVMVLIAYICSGGRGLDLVHSPPGAPPRSLRGAMELLGGRFGTWGGVGLVVATAAAVYGIHEIFNYWMGLAVIKGLEASGHAPPAIAARIEKLPLSRGLKRRLRARIGRTSD